MDRYSRCAFTALIVLLLCIAVASQTRAQAANQDANYQSLRRVSAGGGSLTVNNLTLQRDAASFKFRSGTFYLLSPVNGRITGAVFVGDGIMTLDPPLASEVRSLSLLTREPQFSEQFSRLVLRFTDNTHEELKKASTSGTQAADGSVAALLDEVSDALRKGLHYNLPARLLQDVLSTQPGGFFAAFVKGKRYSSKLLYIIDPHGVARLGGYPGYLPEMEVAPEEVALLTYDENRYGTWASFHLSEEYAAGRASGTQQNRVLDIQQQQLDATIENTGTLSGVATTTFTALSDGVHMIPFDLFRKLRVQAVSDKEGNALRFIQEDRDEDWDYWVILPRELKRGDTYSLKTTYSGKEAVLNEGSGNYFPIARHNWYPNSAFGDYVEYEMTFRIPKNLKMVATGSLLQEKNEGDWNISQWKSEAPQAVAGFNFGRMKRAEAKVANPVYLVESYANADQPDWIRSIMRSTEDAIPVQGRDRTLMHQPVFGTMNTTDLMKKALGEGQLSVQLFGDYFGTPSYKRAAITQQVSCGFGQSWPDLIYLPLCSFLDDTTRHQLFRGWGLTPFISR